MGHEYGTAVSRLLALLVEFHEHSCSRRSFPRARLRGSLGGS